MARSSQPDCCRVSIPNGDRHYLELHFVARSGKARAVFQSPMGIGITSNQLRELTYLDLSYVSIPNGDRHYLEPDHSQSGVGSVGVSIPNGDRHYLELEG